MEFQFKSTKKRLLDNWKEKMYDEPLRCNYIKLHDAASIVRLSFIAHRSINHLDLSVCENLIRPTSNNELPVCKGSIITQEDCRKVMIPGRTLLYRLHLDCPRKLEMSLHLEIIPFTSYYLEGILYDVIRIPLIDILLPRKFYLDILRQFLSETIKNNKIGLEIIQKLLGTIKRFFGNLISFDRKLFPFIVTAVYVGCNDTKFLKEFISAFDLKVWILSGFHFCNSKMLDFILFHGKNIGQPNYFRGDLVNACMMQQEYKKVVVLLKYINSPIFTESDYKRSTRGLKHILFYNPMFRQLDRAKPVREGLMSKERNLQALLIIHLFQLVSDDGIQALRLFWRAIPDIFFNLSEWMDAFGSQLDIEILRQVDKLYSEIIEEDTSIRRPRSLRQYCRVTLRKALYECQNLPNGIEMLNLDSKSKVFLRFTFSVAYHSRLFLTLSEWMDLYRKSTMILKQVDKLYSEITGEFISFRKPRFLRQNCRITLFFS